MSHLLPQRYLKVAVGDFCKWASKLTSAVGWDSLESKSTAAVCAASRFISSVFKSSLNWDVYLLVHLYFWSCKTTKFNWTKTKLYKVCSNTLLRHITVVTQINNGRMLAAAAALSWGYLPMEGMTEPASLCSDKTRVLGVDRRTGLAAQGSCFRQTAEMSLYIAYLLCLRDNSGVINMRFPLALMSHFFLWKCSDILCRQS